MRRTLLVLILCVSAVLLAQSTPAAAQTGTISGTITNATSGAPIQSVFVNIRTSTGGLASGGGIVNTQSNASGVYSVTGLAAGVYFADTNPQTLGFIGQSHSGRPCFNLLCGSTLGTPIVVTAGGTTPINFALEPGGTITGTVTNASTSAVVAGVSVRLYSNTGTSMGVFATTNASGVYTIPGVPTGSYYLRTENTLGLVDQLTTGVTCARSVCTTVTALTVLTTANPISVTQPNSTTVNFSLAPGGSITGTVTNATTNALLSGIIVDVFNSAGTFVATANSNASGLYTVTGLPTGTYFARTNRTLGSPFLNTMSGGLSCRECPAVTTATPIVVTEPNPSTQNFAMVTGAAITGTVRNATTTAGVAGVRVLVANLSGGVISAVNEGITNASGVYSLPGLVSGSYLLRTSNTAGLVDQRYNGITCPGGVCTATAGTLLPLTQPNTTTVDFSLAPGGSITGTITNSATTAAVSGVTVSVFSTAGTLIASAASNASGLYNVTGLSAGQYFVRTSGGGPLGLIDQLSSGVTCPYSSCSVTSGSAVTVTVPNAATLNFALAPGGSISGTVTNASSSATVNGATITIATSTTTSLTTTSTTGLGAYTVNGLPVGTYFARAASSAGLIDEVFDDIGCIKGVCPALSSGTGISVTASNTSTANFALTPGGSITGIVRHATTSAPMAGVTVSVFTSTGTTLHSVTTDASGRYTVDALPTGSYRARASNAAGMIDQLYSGTDCPSTTCTVSTGTAVSVTTGNVATADFNMVPGATFTGLVRNATTNAPIPGVTVSILTPAGSARGSAVTNLSGVFTTTTGLPTGSYVLRTTNSASFVDQVHSGLTCFLNSCPLTGATAVAATAPNASTVNFDLLPGATITGTIRNATTTAPVASVTVTVFNSAGTTVSSGSTNAAGQYTITRLATGSYFVRTSNSVGLIDQLHGAIDCAAGSCTVTTGTAVALTAPDSTTVDFNLVPGGTITGTVRNASTTAGVSGVTVSILTSTGGTFTSATTNAFGVYTVATGIPTGNYRMRTSNTLGLVDQLHSGINCPNALCTVTTGTAVAVTQPDPTTVDFNLAVGGSITGTVTADGVPVTLASVFIVNASNQTVRQVGPNAAGEYSAIGLPGGTYYARVTNTAGFIQQAYPLRNCLNCNATTTGDPISVTLGSATPNINFALVPGARVSGTIRDSSGAPLAGITVNMNDKVTGVFVNSNSGFSAADGTYTIVGLAAGTAVVKTSNSLGYLDKLYNNIPCLGCNVTAGTPVIVGAGATVTGIDFTLVAGGRISGTITNSTTSAPVGSYSVLFYNSSGTFVTSTSSNSLGVYTSPALPTGTYFALTTTTGQGLVNEVYNNITCIGCGGTQAIGGTAIPVVAGATVSNVNFALAPGGSITGTVRNSANAPVSGASISIFNASNVSVLSASTNSSGVFTAAGLQSGTYYVKTNLGSSLNFINQVFKSGGNVSCQTSTCNATDLGSAVTVTSPNAAGSVDFTLVDGGSITGRITDAATTLPLGPMAVNLYDSGGLFLRSATSSASTGVFVFNGLTTGRYYLRTSSVTVWINQLLGGSTCAFCSPTTSTPIDVVQGAALTGRDFALVQGARVTGTITGAAGAPLANVSVSLTPAGSTSSIGSALTNASGVYSVAGLPAGTYYAKTSNSLGYINEVFDNLTCVACSASTGTPIVLAAGATGTANFALALGGKISGTVLDAGTEDPISGASVQIYNGSGTFITSGLTNDAGAYVTSGGFPTGTYFAYVSAGGYVPKVYNNITCTSCSRISGAPIAVTSGATTSGINFDLAPGGRVTGRVVNASDGTTGIESVLVSIYDKSSGVFVASANTGASGAYNVVGLGAGTYTARTSNGLGFINELYNDLKCATCSTTSGAPFTVVAGAATENIDFALDRGMKISGTVMDTGSVPLSGVVVSIYNQANQFVTSATTNQIGAYATAGIVAGRYFARTTTSPTGFINQLYSGIPCNTCSANSGTAIEVTSPNDTTGISFTLARGGIVTGTVKNAANEALEGVLVRILDVSDVVVKTVTTDATGTYTAAGLATDTYFAKTANTLGLIDRIYNGVPCLFCSVTAGTPIPVMAGATVANINFTLSAGGSISGTVVGPDAAALADVNIDVYGASGQLVQRVETDALGRYFTTVGLAPGNYFVRTVNSQGFIDELYNDLPCVGCNPGAGTAVAVTSTSATTGIDFALALGGRITGTVTSSTGTPIENVTVTVFTANGISVTTGVTNSIGAFRSGAVPAGAYYLKTRNTQGFTDQVYDGKECSSCNPTTGTAVVVANGSDTTAINFALVFGGRISGSVKTAVGAAIPGVSVTIFTAGGLVVSSGVSDGLGNYTVSAGLPTGTYYASTNNSQGYVDEIYNNVTCVGCLPTVGAPIAVTAGSVTTDIDFVLAPGGRISGTVLEAGTSAPIVSGFVNIFSSTGVFITQAAVGNSGAYITGTGLAPGTYFARAASRLGYVSKVHDNIDCTACSPITGTPITVTADTTTTGINFVLTLGGRLSGTVTDSTTGVPLRGVTITTWNPSNSLVTTSTTDASGLFQTASGLTPGTYYVRTQNSQGYVDEVYNNVNCLTCLPNIGNAITVTAGGLVTGIDFALAPGGRISGRVTEAATALPLSNVGIRIFDTEGKLVGNPLTDSAGGFVTTGGLPAGTYYARTDNSLGFLDTLFNSITCVACNPLLGTAITVAGTATTSNINFALAGGGGLSGTVTSTDSSQPLANVKVGLFNAAGSLLGIKTTDGSGQFGGSGLPAGTYYLRTFNLLGFVDEAFNNILCAPCPILNSTPVTITAGATTTGRNFALATGGLVTGYVIDSASNAPLVGVTVSFFTTGNVFVGKAQPTDDQGYYAISLPVGTYTAVADAVSGYSSQTVPASDSAGTFGPGRTFGRRMTVGGTVSVGLGQETGGVTFGLAACTPPAFTTITLPTVTFGSSFAQTIGATGGSGGYNFAVSDGQLTPGLALATSGALSGTATVQGTANFTVSVADSAACSATQTYAQFTCGVALATPGASAQSAASSGTVGVGATSTDCAWTAVSNASWITLTSAGATGNGTIAYSLQANTGASRTGTITAAGQTFTITQGDPAAPAITTQPSSQPSSIGANVSFTSAASGDPTPTYQWQVSTNGGVSYSNISNGTPYSGATTTTLTITSVPGTLHLARFRMVATNSQGTATSTGATLTLANAMSIDPLSLRFAAAKAGALGALTSVTGAQTLTVTFAGTGGSWTATSNQSWLTVTGGSGAGAGQFTAAVVNPGNVIAGSTSLTATITVTSGSAPNSPVTVPVTLTVDQSGAATVAAFGQVDTPVQNAAGVVGAIGVTGWVVDDVGISHVRIYRNCLSFDNQASCQVVGGVNVVFIGTAVFVAGARPDVEAAFPTYPASNVAGWGFLLLTNLLPNVTNQLGSGGQGSLDLYAFATDIEGNVTRLGRTQSDQTPTSITMANATIAKPFGALDTPSQGGTVAGTFPTFGWVLTPDSNTTADGTDILMSLTGANMRVFIDGVAIGNVTYNQCRGTVGNPVTAGLYCNDDVANVFGNATPQATFTTRTANATLFRNLDMGRAAIGSFEINTSAMTNGMHSIAWGVTDTANRTEGIGSRNFFVLNTGADVAGLKAGASRSAPFAESRGDSAAIDALPAAVATVSARSGFSLDTPLVEVVADAAGDRRVQIGELDRVELHLGAGVTTGHLVVNGTLRDLPAGSHLDAATGTFTWAPAPGYLGSYTLVFVQGAGASVRVTVTIRPTAPTPAGESEIRMHVDTPEADATVSGPLTIAGWSLDARAFTGSGIGAVHVWARRVDVPTLEPEFVGAATLDVARPDVASAFGAAHHSAGFALTATLASGVYDITVYAWNHRTARWEDARTVRVTVR